MIKESELTPESAGYQSKTQFYAYVSMRLHSSFTDTPSTAHFFGQSYNKLFVCFLLKEDEILTIKDTMIH